MTAATGGGGGAISGNSGDMKTHTVVMATMICRSKSDHVTVVTIIKVTGMTLRAVAPRWIPCTKASDAELWCYFFFDMHPNKRLSKQWRGWWFETLSCLLWRHRHVEVKCLPFSARHKQYTQETLGAKGFVSGYSNKVWWLCLVPTSTTRFASDVGYRMAKI